MTRPQFNFSGKVALVTGATSGIGAAVATAFAASETAVCLTGRSQARGQAIQQQLATANQPAHFIAGDLTEPEFCRSLVAETIAKFGRLDIVVNSAGVIHHATAEETSDEQWHDTFNVNVHALFYVCRAALPHLRSRGGVIVNIASDAGLGGSQHLVAYCASKGAVIQMSRAMARDHAHEGIRVVAICPGDVDTPMLRGEFTQRGITAETGLAEAAAAVPLQRICTAEEVADAVLYAASDAARFMTGWPIVLDGGYRA